MADETPGGNTTADAPLTFADAYAADTSPVSDTPPSSESTTTPAAGQPGAEQGSPQPTERSRYIPRDRFDEVNTRLKAAEAWRQEHGWADQIDPKVLQEAVDFYSRYTGDPVEYVQQLIADIQNDPVHGAKLRSIAGRTLGTRQQPAPETAPMDLNPIAVELADGRVIQVHTAEQIAALKGQWSQEMEQKFQPAMTAADKLQRAEAVAEADQFANNLMSELKRQPGFEQHKAAIGADVRKQVAQLPRNDPRGDQPAWLEAATLRAYNRVVLPTLTATAQSSQLDDLQRQARASTGINPASVAPTSPRRPKDFNDPSLKW